MFCPNCKNEINFKDDENTAVCENCGCVITLSVSAAAQPGSSKVSAASDEAPSKEERPLKKQLNVFGPAALALGLLTVLFAFLSGIKALVLGIPGLIVGALGLLACYLIKNTKKRLSIAGLILSAAGIIIAIVMHSGIVF